MLDVLENILVFNLDVMLQKNMCIFCITFVLGYSKRCEKHQLKQIQELHDLKKKYGIVKKTLGRASCAWDNRWSDFTQFFKLPNP